MTQEQDRSFFQMFETVRSQLKTMIYDQDDAVDEVVDGLIHMSCRPEDSQPRGIFTFLGPDSVGKIYLARGLGEFLEGYSYVIHLDMEQYSDPETIFPLLGVSAGQEGVTEGDLVRAVREHPRCIIVFEGIEKADNQLHLALLNLLSSGDPDSGVSFRETIIIFTSTLGSGLYRNRDFMEGFSKNRVQAQDLAIKVLAREKKVAFDMVQPAIAPKLLEVMGRNFIMFFNRLSLESMVRIGCTSLDVHAKKFGDKSGITFQFRDVEQLMSMLVLSLGAPINAKKIKQQLPEALLGRVTRYAREGKIFPQKVVFKVSKQASEFIDTLQERKEDLLHLYKKNETISLAWKEYMRGSTLFLTVAKGRVEKVSAGEELIKGVRPCIEFSTIGFADIAGNKATKETLRQIITLLKNPGLVTRFDIDMPKGMLIYGSSGVGKTMLSKAFIKEMGLPYVYASRTDLFDPEYISKAYNEAREYAPSIVFLDGIDVKGLLAGVLTTMPDDQLVLELDSVKTDPADLVFTIATAQNRQEVSPVLISPGRIDTFVEVPELDREARRFFIDKILKKPNDGKINVERVIRYISGMNGYDLQRIGKEASLYAIRNGLKCLTEEILIEQINIIKYGYKLEKKHMRNLDEELRITAYHEAGHAVLSFLLLPDIKIEQVTIAPRLQVLGFISYTLEDFPGNISKDEIFHNTCVLMAGRVASMKQFGGQGLNTGAANDLEQATQQAYAAVASLGMDETIGYVHTDTLSQNVSRQIFLSTVENQVQYWIKDATEKAVQLVDAHWPKIEKLASILIQHEIVDGADLARIMKE